MKEGSKMVELIRDLFLMELSKPDITEGDLAGKLGLNQGTIAKYIKYRTKKPNIDTLHSIAKYFNKPIEYFLDGQPEIAANVLPIDLMKDEIDKIYRTIDNTQREKLLEFARDRKILSNSKEGLYRDDTPAGKERGQRRKKN
jgi:transcriptional regulator with XRE-family HTH domain